MSITISIGTTTGEDAVTMKDIRSDQTLDRLTYHFQSCEIKQNITLILQLILRKKHDCCLKKSTATLFKSYNSFRVHTFSRNYQCTMGENFDLIYSSENACKPRLSDLLPFDEL